MREFINKNDYYGQIKLWKSSRKEDSVAILVESKSDEIFFRKLFNEKTATIFSVNGYQNVIDVLNKIQEKDKFNFVIGVIDADFRRITNENLGLKTIFLTDGHDLEMMTIKSDVWDLVINQYKDKVKLDSFEKIKGNIKDFLLKLSKEVANVRFLNHAEKLDLIFKSVDKKCNYNFIDYADFIDKNTLDFNKKAMLKIIENKSQKLSFFGNNPNYTTKLDEISNVNYDLYDFCNGHDFMNILALSFEKAIGSKKLSGKALEDSFCISYRSSDFQKTELYSSLTKWEKSNLPLKIFKE